MTPVLNKALPDFEAQATSGVKFTPQAFSGQAIVLYFYPKDHTPGCTTEGMQFRDLHKKFVDAGARVYGVSRDSLKSHESFKAKMKFPFDLLSDADEKICEQFGVMKMKSLYGRKYRGIERSTFVIDKQGALAREWRGVKVPGHAQEVLDFVKTL